MLHLGSSKGVVTIPASPGTGKEQLLKASPLIVWEKLCGGGMAFIKETQPVLGVPLEGNLGQQFRLLSPPSFILLLYLPLAEANRSQDAGSPSEAVPGAQSSGQVGEWVWKEKWKISSTNQDQELLNFSILISVFFSTNIFSNNWQFLCCSIGATCWK